MFFKEFCETIKVNLQELNLIEFNYILYNYTDIIHILKIDIWRTKAWAEDCSEPIVEKMLSG